MEKLGNILIIIIATVLMQYHGIMFWVSIVGSTGIVWSIALEASALWLWFYSEQKRTLAIIASMLLLAGPLFHIASPIFETTRQQELSQNSRTSSIELLREDIETAEASLATALENSKTRAGWLNDIQTTKFEISEKRSHLAALIQQETPPQYIRQWLIATIQAAALLIVWLVSVYAIRALSQSRLTTPKPKEKPKNTKLKSKTITIVENTTTNEVSIENQNTLEMRVIEALKQELKQQKLSQANWGKLVGISRNNVSLILNHAKHVANNKATAPKKQFLKAAVALGITAGENKFKMDNN